MNDLELIRAYVQGSLSASERAAVAARLESETALQELAETYRLVVDATSSAVPVCETNFDGLALTLTPGASSGRWLYAAAAALLLAVGTFFFWPNTDSQTAQPAFMVHLASIRRGTPLAPAARPLRDPVTYQLATEDGLFWLGDLDEAKSLAQLSGRTVLFFIDYPGCPWCQEYEDGPFRDAKVIAAAEPFVLARLSWEEVPEQFQENINDGWPIFKVLDATGSELQGFKGRRNAAALAQWISETHRNADLSWAEVRRLSRLLVAAGRQTDLGKRYRMLAEVVADDPQGEFGKLARAGQLALESDALAFLRAAEGKTPAAAARLLADAVRRLKGTPFAADLEMVHRYVGEHGAFPRLRYCAAE